MKIFCAGLATETNAFSPFPTFREDFEESGIARGNASSSGTFLGNLVAIWKSAALAGHHEFTEGQFAGAPPAGPILWGDYQSLRDETLAPLAAGTFDVVLLFLHGAMAADGEPDCEGDMLERARLASGPSTVIGAVLDPHCHLSDRMLRFADLLVVSHEYPHTDYPERTQQLFDLCIATKEGRIRPVPGVFDCNMIGFFPTRREPMASLTRLFASAETEQGVVAAAFIHGFELGDNIDLGCKALVYADGDSQKANEVARRLGLAVYRERRSLGFSFATADEAFNAIEHVPGLSVIADAGDNPGAGYPGDHVGLLREALVRDVDGVVCGTVYDPLAVELCVRVGVGSTVDIRIGGKLGRASGAPLDLAVTVRSVVENLTQPVFGTGEVSCGRSVCIESRGVRIILSSRRQQVYSPEVFERMGIDLATAKVAIVKSGEHFRTSFQPLATLIVQAAAPDAIGADLLTIPHRIRRLDYFPRVSDPLGIGA